MGKTDILKLIFKSNIEIINADSMQVYRYMDIGTAKPPEELLARFPHHLVDAVYPDHQFNVGEFIRRTESLIPEIIQRGAFPVLTGGTAYYLKSFAYGLPEAPKSDKAVRDKVLELERSQGLTALYDKLCRVDPVYGNKIGRNDRSRIIRALEVYLLTGLPLSSYSVPARLRDKYRFLFVGLTRPKEELGTRIERRVDSMFDLGLVDEVKALLERGYTWLDPGMRGIGYFEFLYYQRGCLSLMQVKDLIKRNTKRYAKRQVTFFKSLPDVAWFHPDQSEAIGAVVHNFF